MPNEGNKKVTLSIEPANFDELSIEGAKVVSVQTSGDPLMFTISCEGGKSHFMTIDEAGKAVSGDYLSKFGTRSVAVANGTWLKKLSTLHGFKRPHIAALCGLKCGQRVSEACECATLSMAVNFAHTTPNFSLSRWPTWLTPSCFGSRKGSCRGFVIAPCRVK